MKLAVLLLVPILFGFIAAVYWMMEHRHYIKKRAARTLRKSIRRIAKIFKIIIAPQGEIVNRKVIYK